MAISGTDHQDLVLALMEGLFSDDAWSVFLSRVQLRTGARSAVLEIHHPSAPTPSRHRAKARGEADQNAAEGAALAQLGLSSLRPGRVYALEELRVLGDTERRAAQDHALALARIGDVRAVRIAAPAGYTIYFLLLHERREFAAADSALLTALVPILSATVASLAARDALRLRLDAAEGALARLGIAQAVLDRGGHAIAHDPHWPERTNMPPAAPETDVPQLVPLAEGPGLVRRMEQAGRADLPQTAAMVAAVRRPASRDPAVAARIIAETFGLSPREAALAALLAQGHALVEAGRILHLTVETSRNYSKRIYAKTGARGQADLVRLILSSLAVLA